MGRGAGGRGAAGRASFSSGDLTHLPLKGYQWGTQTVIQE